MGKSKFDLKIITYWMLITKFNHSWDVFHSIAFLLIWLRSLCLLFVWISIFPTYFYLNSRKIIYNLYQQSLMEDIHFNMHLRFLLSLIYSEHLFPLHSFRNSIWALPHKNFPSNGWLSNLYKISSLPQKVTCKHNHK